MTFLYVFCATVLLFVIILMMLVFIRAMYSLFFAEEGPFFSFLFAVTEPVIYPIRSALSHSQLFSSLPVDFSCALTFLVLFFVRTVLSMF